MQRGSSLQFDCQACGHAVCFSLFDLQKEPLISCHECKKTYLFNDETLIKQLKKFESLCRAIHDAEEILSSTSVGVDVGTSKVKIPFKLLLTRLSSYLDLKIGGKPFTISFRFEPLKDTAPL